MSSIGSGMAAVPDELRAWLPGSPIKAICKKTTPYCFECALCTGLISGPNWNSCPNCHCNLDSIYVTRFSRFQASNAPTMSNPTGGYKMPQGGQNVRIWWDSAVGAYRLTMPYNPTFQELFKGLIPHSDRHWSAESKTWTVTEKFFKPVKDLIEKTYGSVTAISREATEKASQPPPIKLAPIDQVLLQFVKLIPHDAMQKAYRAGAMLLHPDRGGDMDKMANLNACWQRLEEEFYKEK